MKIRTDFVTNSSSSSYVVSIRITDIDGKSYDMHIYTEYDCDYGIGGDAEKYLQANSLEELFSYMISTFYFEEEKRPAGYYDEYNEKDPESTEEYWNERVKDYIKNVEENLGDINRIKTIEFMKEFYTYGESSIGLWYYIEENCPDLVDLAKRVAEGDESMEEKFRDALHSWKGSLEGGWGDTIEINGIYWDENKHTIREFAYNLVNHKLNDDKDVYGKMIDLQNKTVSEIDRYYPNGSDW